MESTAFFLAAGKLSPVARASLSAIRYSCGSSQSSPERGNSPSNVPASLPKTKESAPRSKRRRSAPSAKYSALAQAENTGSSTIRSAPQARAASERAYLENSAGAPRCTKAPLKITMIISAPVISRARLKRRACPLWSGLNSAMIPVIFMMVFPFSKI